MSDDIDPEKPASDQFDLTAGMDFDVEPTEIAELAEDLEKIESLETQLLKSETLADYVHALKRLENAVETARKEVVEDALKERTKVGERVGPLVKQTGMYRQTPDDDAVVDAIQDAGGDPVKAMEVKESDAVEVLEALGLDPDDYIDEITYEYFRRQS